MEKVVSYLKSVVEKQDKIVDRIFNGMVHEIVDGVCQNYNNVHKETIDSLKRIEECNKESRKEIISVSADAKHAKWFVAIVILVTVVVNVLMTNIERKSNINTQTQAIVKELIKEVKNNGN